MINIQKNKLKMEAERARFNNAKTCEEYENLFQQLLREKENIPEYKELVIQYREADAFVKRSCIKEANLNKNNMTDEEISQEIKKSYRDADHAMTIVFETRQKILEMHYRDILKEDD